MDDYNWVRSLEFWMETWRVEEPNEYFGVKRKYFKEKSKNYWAASEVIEEVRRNPGGDPIETVIEFNKRMEKLYFLAKTEKAKSIFLALRDTSSSMLDYMLACTIY